MTQTIPLRMTKDELANSLTHGLGILLGIIAIPFLGAKAIISGNLSAIIGSGMFGFGFMMVFTFSTLYHSIVQPDIKKTFRILDHISIYFMIAGSYTPFILIYMPSKTGYIILAVQWILTLLGTIYKIFFTGKFKWFSTIVYLAMGWMIVLVIGPFVDSLPLLSLWLIVAGGLLYTVGVVFYKWYSLPYHHAIWHVFVLAASICHFVAVWVAVK
ncbi:MAG: hemolysin III family protein [Bacteroidota bacterium]